MGTNRRNVDVADVRRNLKEMFIEACTKIDDDLRDAFVRLREKEESPTGKSVFDQIIRNAEVAGAGSIPLCQDTGFAVVYLEVGQEVSFTGGSLHEAIEGGVRAAYEEGYLRKSIVKDPLTSPQNTNDNTPPIVHTDIVPGDEVKISVLPKGGGSENMSRIKMMKPADGVAGVKNFVIETVKIAGANPCPPVLIGVGVGGTFDYVAYLAKKALLRKIGQRNPDETLAGYEVAWLDEVNRLGIGPAGLGGRITAVELFLEVFPRHIASFPAAVNIQCHSARSLTRVLR